MNPARGETGKSSISARRRFVLCLALLCSTWLVEPGRLSAEMRLGWIRVISEDLAYESVRHPANRSVAMVLQDRRLVELDRYEICLDYLKYNLRRPPRSKGYVSAKLEVLRAGGATTLFEFERVPVRSDRVSQCRLVVEPFSSGDVLFASFHFSGMARVRAGETPQVAIRIYPPAASRSTVRARGGTASAPREIAPRVMDTHYRQVAAGGTKHPARARVSLVVTDDRFPNPEEQFLCTYYGRYTVDGRRPDRGAAVVRVIRERAGEEPVDLVPPTRMPVRRQFASLDCPRMDLELQVGDVITAEYRLKKMPKLRAGEEMAIHLQLNP